MISSVSRRKGRRSSRAAPSPAPPVELLRNGKVHDKAIADAAGQFAMVPPSLPSGSHDLTLVMITPDGKRETSRQSVAVLVPADPSGSVVVALASPDKPTEILSQTPTAAAKAPAKSPPVQSASSTTGERPRVLLGSVEAEDTASSLQLGRALPAPPSGSISTTHSWRLLRQGRMVDGRSPSRAAWSPATTGSASTMSTARARSCRAPKWRSISVRSSLRPTIAAGKAGSGANTEARLGTRRPARSSPRPLPCTGGADIVVDEIKTATVSRGDSLWRISKRVYGKGLRYTVIYEANVKQIRDPSRIYPGQLFVLPGQVPN